MEELRIKCPSCGIILDVRNSKNEAVKTIVCPNCKKHLAVTFREAPQPAQFVEIKMVQLADGSTKTIVRALTDEHVVKVNGEQLQKDDEVVLSVGDELQIDDTVGVFGQEGHVNYQQPTIPVQSSKPNQPAASKSPNPYQLDPSTVKTPSRWAYYVIPAVVVFLAIVCWQLWQRQSEALMVDKPDSVKVEETDTPKVQAIVKEATSKPSKKQEVKQRVAETKQTAHSASSLSSLSTYELEKLAMSGHVDAQYELGKRWVNKHDSINVVKGIKYLKLAAQNGSSDARSALRTVFAALQQSAANGSSTASNILREQR